jgi:hypothetical protein
MIPISDTQDDFYTPQNAVKEDQQEAKVVYNSKKNSTSLKRNQAMTVLTTMSGNFRPQKLGGGGGGPSQLSMIPPKPKQMLSNTHGGGSGMELHLGVPATK